MNPEPMSFATLDAIARDAQIKFCMKDVGRSFEHEFALSLIAARDAQWAAMLGEPVGWLVHAKYPFMEQTPQIEGGLPRSPLYAIKEKP